MNWEDIREIFSLAINLIIMAAIIAFMRILVQSFRANAHLSNFSERVVRVDGRFPYTLQVTVVPEFPVMNRSSDIERGANVAPAA